MDWMDVYSKQSSVKSLMWLNVLAKMSLMNNRIKIGPKTDSCGMPDKTAAEFDA